MKVIQLSRDKEFLTKLNTIHNGSSLISKLCEVKDHTIDSNKRKIEQRKPPGRLPLLNNRAPRPRVHQVKFLTETEKELKKIKHRHQLMIVKLRRQSQI